LSFLARRARSSWLLLACVAVTVLLTTGLAAVLWTFSVVVIPPGALSTLAAPQGRMITLNGVVGTAEAATDTQQIRAALRKAWPGVGFQLESALWANPIQLSFNATTIGGGAGFMQSNISQTSTQVEPASLEDFSGQVTLTAGKWPGPPEHGDPVPVALPAAVASTLHVRLGSVLTGSPDSSNTKVSFQVTGLYRPKDPASPYWGLDLLPTSGIGARSSSVFAGGASGSEFVTSYGPAIVDPAALGGTLAVAQGSWTVLPQASALANGNIAALAASTSAALSQLSVVLPEGLKVSSSLPQLLSGIARTTVLARSLFVIGALELLLVAGAELALAARLLVSLREEESALLRARGATRWQVARPVLAEAMVIGVVAGLVGAVVGTRVTGVLASLVSLRVERYSGIPPLAWLSALAIVLLCAVVMVWPALRVQTPDAARRRRGRQARLAGIAWAGGDLAVVALAAVAVWELRGYSAVAQSATGSLGIDPVVAIAPALAVAGVALIPLRGLPLLARLADKATDYERRLAAAMVSWQIARRPIRQAGPVLLVTIATAITTLALATSASWQQSAADQAAFAVGSDAQVNSAGPLPLGAAGTITGARGVTSATSASVTSMTNGGQLIALNASTADKTIMLRSDLSSLPASTLWQRIIPRQSSGLALPGQPDRLEILATLGVSSPVSKGSNENTEVQRALGSAMVTASIQEGDGDTYEIPATSPVPFDGRQHALVFSLPGSRQASAPLRLLGFSLSYHLPPYDTVKTEGAISAAGPTGTLTVQSLAVSATASGPFGKPFSGGRALAPWLGNGVGHLVPTGPADPYGGTPPSDGSGPTVMAGRGAPGGAERFTFDTGWEPSPAVMFDVNMVPGSATGEVSYTAQPAFQAVPAIATTGFLTANRLRVGSTFSTSVDTYSTTFQIVASVARFPTVLGQNIALITDLGTINGLLVANQAVPLPVTRWWLRTADGGVPSLPSGLGLSVTSRASQQAALTDNALLKAPRQALLAIGLAAVLLGVLGFSISVAAGLRSRRTQSAVFAALGVGKNAQAGQLCLEQLALSLPAAAVGLLAGIGLAQLIVPAITLTADAAAPVPAALAVVPLGPAVALALVTAAVPVAAAALTVARRPDPAAQLRAEAR
jgi:predicted lysophospholipase L1 biosynthesis ABC-type transport system permease subunit